MSCSVNGKQEKNEMSRVAAKWLALNLLVIAAVFVTACGKQEPAGDEVYTAVDELYTEVMSGVENFDIIAEIDHSRLAIEAGEVMPPARVVLFSDPDVNASILQQEPIAGLEQPSRETVVSDGGSPRVIYTPAEFLARRHGLTEGRALARYRMSLDIVLMGLPSEKRVAFDVSNVTPGQGISELNSKYSFSESIERLREAIMAEGDTMWFGEIDYQAEAAELGVDLPQLTLLLFGAPGPGAKAMAEYPRMGLDAFCQKLLVVSDGNGGSVILFNDIAALAELHYGKSAKPHHMLNKRLTETFRKAI